MEIPMHRRVLCLPLLLATLAACDDDASPREAAPVAACGMALPGVGAWTVAQYDDGFLIEANRAIALRSIGDDLRWHRLDGTDDGVIRLGPSPTTGRAASLYNPEHVIARELTEQFEERTRLIRIRDGRVMHDILGPFEAWGDWIITDHTSNASGPSRLHSLATGRVLELPCASCRFVGLDGIGRLWVGDYDKDTLIHIDAETGRIDGFSGVQPWRARVVGGGVVIRQDDTAVYLGVGDTRVTCDSDDGQIAPNGLIACPNDAGVEVFDADGEPLRSVPNVSAGRIRMLGAGFLTSGGSRSLWVPFDPDVPVISTPGRVAAANAHVGIIHEVDGDRLTIVHADGRTVELSGMGANVEEVSASGRWAAMRVEADAVLLKLDSGAIERTVPLDSGWRRFVGDVWLVNGAPEGGAPLTTASRILVPHRRCPVLLYEQCEGSQCALNIQQFEDPASLPAPN